jgi:hypothetical protein
MRFEEYQYLFPPRPDNKIPANLLGFYEKRKWFAQVKKNGTCCVIFARGLEVIFKQRHFDEDHRQWSPLPEHIRFFQSSSTEWNVYVGELIHNKTAHIKNQLYLFDQIVKDGEHLVGTTLRERQEMLLSNWATTPEFDQHRVNQYISVARNFTSNFGSIYKDIIPKDGLLKENEGLVLKNPDAKMSACFRGSSNNSWQVKCRVPHKNYSF